MPRQSMNTHANLSRAKRRTERRLLPAIWLEPFPAAPLTFGSFSNSKGTGLRRWKSYHEERPAAPTFSASRPATMKSRPARHCCLVECVHLGLALGDKADM